MAEDIFGNHISAGDEVVVGKKLSKGEVFSVAQDGDNEVIMVKFRDGRGKVKYEPFAGENICVVGNDASPEFAAAD